MKEEEFSALFVSSLRAAKEERKRERKDKSSQKRSKSVFRVCNPKPGKNAFSNNKLRPSQREEEEEENYEDEEEDDDDDVKAQKRTPTGKRAVLIYFLSCGGRICVLLLLRLPRRERKEERDWTRFGNKS